MDGLRAAADASAGDWIAPRLGGDFGAVGRTVPRGYAAYARVLHPVEPGASGPTTWAGVCALTGRTPHALMQWEAITSPGGEEFQVLCGNLAPPALRALLEVLAPFTGEQECHLALWEGWGWLFGGGTFVSFSRDAGSPPPTRAAVPAVLDEALNGPRLSLPGREFLLFTGPLSAAAALGDQVTDDWFDPQSPNLLWPEDRSWCVVGEIDFDSTLVGGPVELVDALLAAPDLEVWVVDPDDDLSSTGDRRNR